MQVAAIRAAMHDARRGLREDDVSDQQMPMHHDALRFTIPRAPFNPYSAEGFGLVFKLAYVSRVKDKPTLEIFLNDEEARRKEWQIYGALLDEEKDSDRFAKLSFTAVGESKPFRIGPDAFEITFVALRTESGCIAGQDDETFVYDFFVQPKCND